MGTVLCQSHAFERSICIPNQQVCKTHHNNQCGAFRPCSAALVCLQKEHELCKIKSCFGVLHSESSLCSSLSCHAHTDTHVLHCSHSSTPGIASVFPVKTFTYTWWCSLHWKFPLHFLSGWLPLAGTINPQAMQHHCLLTLLMQTGCTWCHLSTSHQCSTINPN